MASADSWHLKSRAHQCAETERPFAEGETFFTAIFPDPESEAYERRDYSEDAWNARPEDADPPFSFWRNTYKPPVHEEKVEVVNKNDVEGLLQRLVEEDEEHTENMRYILAVMLERKKLLVETDKQQTPSGLLRIYEHRKTGEIFIVKDPQVALSEVDSIQQEVRELLEPSVSVPEESATDGEEAPEPSGSDGDEDDGDEDDHAS